jgi:hypothetical protein
LVINAFQLAEETLADHETDGGAIGHEYAIILEWLMACC